MAQQTLSMQARTGRSNQRYGSNGERLVAGIVPLSADKVYVLLIQSSSHNKWVLPKGGWETDEATAQDAACREAWEEAGIVCKVNYDLGHIDERRSPSQFTKDAPRASYHFFEATVERMENEWPEAHKRNRKWCTYAEATQALKGRPELLAALEKCSIRR